MSAEEINLAPLQQRARELIAAAVKAGAEQSDAIVGTSRESGVDVREGVVTGVESAENDAFALRVFVGKRSASVSANRGGDPSILAERAVAMARAAPENPHAGLADRERLANEIVDLDLNDLTGWSVEKMTEAALTCEAAAMSVKGVTRSSGAAAGVTFGATVLASSDGFDGAYRASRYATSVSAVAGEGTGMERDYDADSQRHFDEMRTPEEIGKRAGKRTVERINPKKIATQSASIIFAPRMARTLLGHLAGAVNGGSIARKTSFLRERYGDSIFGSKINIIDTPHVARGLGSRPFDGEGVAGEPVDIVREGQLSNWLLDSATARELGLTTNGRASRSGSGTVPGTTNLTMEAGDASPEDLMKSIGTGLYVTELIGQGVNLVTGKYSRGASGFWIENGEIAYPVSEVTIAGDLGEMFASLVPANDLEFRHAVNAPSVLVEGLTLAGK